MIGTLEQLEKLHEHYERVKKNPIRRIAFGLKKEVAPLRAKLTVHIELINRFLGHLSMEGIGAMIPMETVISLLVKSASLSNIKAIAGDSSSELYQWELLKIELLAQDIPNDFVRDNQQLLMTLAQRIAEQDGRSENGTYEEDFDDIEGQGSLRGPQDVSMTSPEQRL